MVLELPTNGAALNANRTVCNITIAESNSPHGVIGFSSSNAASVEQGSAYMLTAIRTGGTFGDVS